MFDYAVKDGSGMQVVNRKLSGILVVSFVASSVVLPAVGYACSVCWSADDPLGHGLFWSSLFLMATPFTLGASIAGVFYFAHRRSRRRQEPPAKTPRRTETN